jgi:hypothetical protein
MDLVVSWSVDRGPLIIVGDNAISKLFEFLRTQLEPTQLSLNRRRIQGGYDFMRVLDDVFG